MTRWLSVIILAVVLQLAAGGALAEPVIFSGNGHAYQYVSAEGISWTDARDAAASSSYRGVAGHLATLTSQSEQEFVVAQVLPTVANRAAWLGGEQDSTIVEPPNEDVGWRWITGELWDYTNWETGEPNNVIRGEIDEDYLAILLHKDKEWIDLWEPGTDGAAGYVVEYDVPVPGLTTLGSAILIAGLALLGVFLMRRRAPSAA